MKASASVPYVAYLRVYEPVAAVRGPAADSWKHWAGLPESDVRTGATLERERGLTGLLATPPVAVPAHDGGESFVLEVEGEIYLCPWETRLRCWVALEELRNTVPDPVLDAFLPRVVVDGADLDFARWRAKHPGASPHILTSSWQVPLRWFVAFSAVDRVVEPARDGAGARLSYRTNMANARLRVARGLQTLRRTFDSSPLSERGRGPRPLARVLSTRTRRWSWISAVWSAWRPSRPWSRTRRRPTSRRLWRRWPSGDSETAATTYRDLVTRWRVLGDYANAS